MKKGKQSKVVVPEELKDFRNFVYLVWEHLGLPNPTKVQYDIASFLQYGPRRKTICAFRGVGKSYLTSAFAVWKLLIDPDINVLVVSASKTRSDDFSTFTQRLIAEMPILEHLRPKKGQRDSKIAFDVGPAAAAHAPSVKSVGITGQLTGSRADYIIADDVESLNNSATQGMREKLGESRNLRRLSSQVGVLPSSERTKQRCLSIQSYQIVDMTQGFGLQDTL